MPWEDKRLRFPVIEPGDCIRCEVCAEACPEVFHVNEAGWIEIADLADYPETCVNEAVRYCPRDCIFWSEAKEEKAS